LATAAALATMQEVISSQLPAHVKEVGAYLAGRLAVLRTSTPLIKEVRGQGLLVAVEFNDSLAADVIGKAIQRGVLLNAVSPTIVRLMPPCIVQQAEVDEVVGVLSEVLRELSA
jgi:acetylornithine/N-succinyldiaminopimelate aminotransferase